MGDLLQSDGNLRLLDHETAAALDKNLRGHHNHPAEKLGGNVPTRRELLSNAVFGSRIAEEEVDHLRSYFVETEQWKRLLNGDVDIVFGAKGAGKSALYSLLVGQRELLRLGRRTLFLPAENPRGTPAFRDLAGTPPMPEESFRGLWKLYLLSIAANYLRHHLTLIKKRNAQAQGVFELLEVHGLLAPNVTLKSRLKAAYDYLRRYFPALEGSLKDPNSGIELKGKITLAEPSSREKTLGHRSLDDLLEQLNSALAEEEITCWLALDRLDVAFADTPELEGNALRSLFRAYLDMSGLSQLKVKIFLRDDIWRKIVDGGFREASHVTRTLTLSWDSPSMLNLLVRRIASNVQICDYYSIDQDELLLNAALQKQLFHRIFPEQVDVGQSKPDTLGWMMSRTADGTKRTAPRELIHLLLEARDEQLKRYQLGNPEPEREQLIDKIALRAALPAISKARFEQTLCAEYPWLKEHLFKLENEKTQQRPESLARIWKVGKEKAQIVAEQLVEAGFFERRGSRDNPAYWVPFLYRDALSMVQGGAD